MSAAIPKDLGEINQRNGASGLLQAVQNNQRPYVARPKRTCDQAISPLPDIIDIVDFLAMDYPEPEPTIEGLLDKGSKMILSGGSKTRKTWILTHLAICIASGSSWWGFNTTRGRVLYINLEIGAARFQGRVRDVKLKLTVEGNQLVEGNKLKGWLQLWNLRGRAADISDLVEEIINRVQDRYEVVIIDPIYKVLGDRDENSNGDVASLMNELDKVVERTGAAVIFAHHYSKGNQAKKDAMDRMSGAGAFARDADTLVSLTKHQTPDVYTVDVTLRNHQPVESFCVMVEHPIMVRWEAGDPAKLKEVNGPEVKYFRKDLLKTLGVQEIRRAELERQYRAKYHASEGAFDTLYKEAVELGEIVKCEGGKKVKAANPVSDSHFENIPPKPEIEEVKVEAVQ